jgi:hypothetical protein
MLEVSTGLTLSSWNILDLKKIENQRKFTSSSARAIYFQTVISPRIEMS